MFTQKQALMAATVAASVALPGIAQAATFYTTSGSCTTTTSCSFTFTADPGFLFIGSSAADVNLTGTVNTTLSSETFTGGTATSSDISFSSSGFNVSSFGRFTVTDDLSSSGSP